MRPTLPLGTSVSLKHGAGGRAMRALIEQLFAEGAQQPPGAVGLAEMDDGADQLSSSFRSLASTSSSASASGPIPDSPTAT